jgi:RNA polymerase sigma-70 factor (ECF subfamily)
VFRIVVMDSSQQVEELIFRAKAANEVARDELMVRYRNYLRMVARVWLDRTVAAKMEPSDVVQETLLRAHRGFDQFQGQSERELMVWLRKILAHYLIDVTRHYRASMRTAVREQSLEAALEQSAARLENRLVATGSSPSQQTQRRETAVLLADALERLKRDHREVILLRSLEELDWQTIASRMRRSPDAARMLWARALCELRPYIESSR